MYISFYCNDLDILSQKSNNIIYKKSIGPKIKKKQIEKFDQSCKNAEVNKGHISTNYLSVYILNLYQHCNPYTQRQIHL